MPPAPGNGGNDDIIGIAVLDFFFADFFAHFESDLAPVAVFFQVVYQAHEFFVAVGTVGGCGSLAAYPAALLGNGDLMPFFGSNCRCLHPGNTGPDDPYLLGMLGPGKAVETPFRLGFVT